jgi:hypothetical protein
MVAPFFCFGCRAEALESENSFANSGPLLLMILLESAWLVDRGPILSAAELSPYLWGREGVTGEEDHDFSCRVQNNILLGAPRAGLTTCCIQPSDIIRL